MPIRNAMQLSQVALACCQASGPGLTSAVAGQVASFRIAAHDANGNPIMTGGANFSARIACEGGFLPRFFVQRLKDSSLYPRHSSCKCICMLICPSCPSDYVAYHRGLEP